MGVEPGVRGLLLVRVLGDQILDVVTTLRSSGVSVLLIEQNVVAALEISDRAYVMETGRIVMSGLSSVLAANDEVRKVSRRLTISGNGREAPQRIAATRVHEGIMPPGDATP